MKRILLASVAALGLAGTASAADLAVAPVVYAPAFTWTSCYLGVNGGWIGSNEDYTLSPTDQYLVLATAAQRAERTYSYSPDSSAGTAGGQFGCQAQIGSWVIGGEWDFNWSGLEEDNVIFAPQTAFWQDWDITSHKQLEWFTTARAKLGFAWDRLMIYATGGLAYASYDAYTQVNFRAEAPPIDLAGAYRENRLGYAVGGGLEWAFANNWSAKAEFLYLDFGSFSYKGVYFADPAFTYTTEVDAKEYVARVGINYMFHPGGAPVVARY